MNGELEFLTFADIMAMHAYQIGHFGGALGIRDVELLKSALVMPSATYGGQYLHTDIFEMAAAYLYHLVANHPFVDGNKRVGAMAALIFLDLNGVDFAASNDELTEVVLAVASGGMKKPEIAVFLKGHAH